MLGNCILATEYPSLTFKDEMQEMFVRPRFSPMAAQKLVEDQGVDSSLQAQPEKYGKDFDATVSYLGQIVAKKSYSMQSVHITKTRNQSVKPKVAAFIRKIECKKYHKTLLNSMSNAAEKTV